MASTAVLDPENCLQQFSGTPRLRILNFAGVENAREKRGQFIS